VTPQQVTLTRDLYQGGGDEDQKHTLLPTRTTTLARLCKRRVPVTHCSPTAAGASDVVYRQKYTPPQADQHSATGRPSAQVHFKGCGAVCNRNWQEVPLDTVRSRSLVQTMLGCSSLPLLESALAGCPVPTLTTIVQTSVSGVRPRFNSKQPKLNRCSTRDTPTVTTVVKQVRSRTMQELLMLSRTAY
jgi:hypothetical protein